MFLPLLAVNPGHAQQAQVSSALAGNAGAVGPDPSEQVVVTATRTSRHIEDVPQSVSVITADQISDTSAQELDDVLRLVPGVDLLGYSGQSQHPTADSIGMRGLGGAAQGISRALVMVDGIPINDAFFGYIQWGRVPLDNIDRVEIVRGGGSPLWGNYAEGGVINIITREPSKQQASFDAGGGSYDTYRANGSGSYVPLANMSLQGSAAISGTGGFQQVPEYERAPFNVPTSYHAVNLQLKGSAMLDDGYVAHASVNYHDNHQRLETLLDDNAQRIYTLTGDVRRRFDSGASVTATAFYSDSDFGTNNSTYLPNAANLSLTTQSLNEVHKVQAYDAGGSLVWSQPLPVPQASYTVGTDVRAIRGSDHTNHYIAPNFSPAFSTTAGHGDQAFLGGFVQASVSPLARLEIIASGRLQYLRDSNGFDGSLGGLGATPDRSYRSFDPRADVRYALTDVTSLRGAYYKSFRAPNIGDEFYTYAAGGFVQLPSPLLRPEHLTGGEVGLDYTRPGLRSQFTLYRTDIDDYIVIEPTANPIYTPAGWFVVQNQNIASVRAQGFEAEVDWDVGPGISTRLAYTWAESVVKSNPLDPASIGQQIIDVPKNKIAADLSYRNKQGWRVSTQVYWIDRTNWASPDHTDPGYPGKLSADPHFLADVSGSYPIYRKVEVYLQIQNLFNRHYIATSYSAPSAQTIGTPLTVFSGIRGTFE